MKKELLNEIDRQIAEGLKQLKTVEIGSEEHANISDGVAALYKLKREEAQATNEQLEPLFQGLKVCVDVGAVVVPVAFYSIWMKRGFKFEETGAICSQTFRGLISKFKPTR